jgi:hypothetical protein
MSRMWRSDVASERVVGRWCVAEPLSEGALEQWQGFIVFHGAMAKLGPSGLSGFGCRAAALDCLSELGA